MRPLSLIAAMQALGLTLTTVDVEAAKRLGGGSSYGMQKKMSPPAKAPAAAAATQAQPKRSWMGPVAGLAAGLGLAALASHLGFGEGLATIMMIGLLVMAAIAVTGLIRRRRASLQQSAMAGAGCMPNAQADSVPGRASWPHGLVAGGHPAVAIVWNRLCLMFAADRRFYPQVPTPCV